MLQLLSVQSTVIEHNADVHQASQEIPTVDAFPSLMVNVRLTLNVLTIELALSINAWTHALLTILVAKMLFVKLPPIDLYVAVQMAGQVIHIPNVTNVGFYYKLALEYVRIYLNSISILDECQVDRDCPLDKACKSQECVNPCLTTQCGSRAQCEVDFHTAICVCPPGLQGNPLVACVEVGCKSNNECATNEICGFVPGSGFTRKECQPLCNPGPCARGADCTARDHRESCTCRHPLTGDGYAACLERKFKERLLRYLTLLHCMCFIFSAVITEEPECRVDADCPRQLTCIRETCQNPCLVQNPCVGSQNCVVKDIGSSLRSVACECPEGLLYGDNGECIKGSSQPLYFANA